MDTLIKNKIPEKKKNINKPCFILVLLSPLIIILIIILCIKFKNRNQICRLKYQIHVSGSGWLGYSNNCEIAGEGTNTIEAIILYLDCDNKIIEKSLKYRVSNVGFSGNGEMSGTTGKSLPIHFFEISDDSLINLKYKTFSTNQESNWTFKGNQTSYFQFINGIQICIV